MNKNTGKKIHVNAASLVDLKAELFKRKEQLKRQRGTQSATTTSKPVSEKTASIWLKKQKPNTKSTATKPTKTAPERVVPLTDDEEKKLARSRAALEAKAALYDKLMKKEHLPEEEEEEDSHFLVDFQQKYINKATGRRSAGSDEAGPPDAVEKNNHDNDGDNDDDEWVEYTDAFGRSRKCLRKDLPEMIEQNDKLDSRKGRERSPPLDLMSDDMRRDQERRRWEEDAYEDLDATDTGPVHFQNVENKEVRTYGAGYYKFDTEEGKRQEQLVALNKLRNQTIDQRKKWEKVKENRKAIAEARLRKIKARKLGLTEDELLALEKKQQPEQVHQEAKEEEKPDPTVSLKLEEMEANMKHMKHLRPWDKGKIVDPIKKRKQELEEERLPEFAPPNSYSKRDNIKQPSSRLHSTEDYTASTNNDTSNSSVDHTADSSTGNATENTAANLCPPPFQLPPLFSNPYSSVYPANTLLHTSANSSETELGNPYGDGGMQADNGPIQTTQAPSDSIQESVAELLRYYKTKSVPS